MIEVRGKNYTVLEIQHKSNHREQDMYVCLSEYGYKECFLGYDIHHPKIDNIHTHSRAWTNAEIQYIKDKLLEGKTVRWIKDNFQINPRRTEVAIERVYYMLKEEMKT